MSLGENFALSGPVVPTVKLGNMGVLEGVSDCELRPEATGIRRDAVLGRASRLAQTGVEPWAREEKADAP